MSETEGAGDSHGFFAEGDLELVEEARAEGDGSTAAAPRGVSFTVSGSGKSQCDGEYRQEGTNSGKPMFKQVGGTGLIYFASFWKLNDETNVHGWWVFLCNARHSSLSLSLFSLRAQSLAGTDAKHRLIVIERSFRWPRYYSVRDSTGDEPPTGQWTTHGYRWVSRVESLR